MFCRQTLQLNKDIFCHRLFLLFQGIYQVHHQTSLPEEEQYRISINLFDLVFFWQCMCAYLEFLLSPSFCNSFLSLSSTLLLFIFLTSTLTQPFLSSLLPLLICFFLPFVFLSFYSSLIPPFFVIPF